MDQNIDSEQQIDEHIEDQITDSIEERAEEFLHAVREFRYDAHDTPVGAKLNMNALMTHLYEFIN